MPGPKGIRLAKKGGGSSYLNAGFRRFGLVILLLPRLFAVTKNGVRRRFLPAFFPSARPFCPGNGMSCLIVVMLCDFL